MSKIELCTLYTADDPFWRRVGSATAGQKRLYSQLHGYRWTCRLTTMDASRPAYWSKWLLLLERMWEGDADWLLWTDADCVIAQPDKRLEEWTESVRDTVCLIGAPGRWRIQTGDFLLRRSEWAIRLAEDVYADTDSLTRRGRETRALNMVLDRRGGEDERVLIVRDLVAVAKNRNTFLIHYPRGARGCLYAGIERAGARLAKALLARMAE